MFLVTRDERSRTEEREEEEGHLKPQYYISGLGRRDLGEAERRVDQE